MTDDDNFSEDETYKMAADDDAIANGEQKFSIADCWEAVRNKIIEKDPHEITEKWLTEEVFDSICDDLYSIHRTLRDFGSCRTDWWEGHTADASIKQAVYDSLTAELPNH